MDRNVTVQLFTSGVWKIIVNDAVHVLIHFWDLPVLFLNALILKQFSCVYFERCYMKDTTSAAAPLQQGWLRTTGCILASSNKVYLVSSITWFESMIYFMNTFISHQYKCRSNNGVLEGNTLGLPLYTTLPYCTALWILYKLHQTLPNDRSIKDCWKLVYTSRNINIANPIRTPSK